METIETLYTDTLSREELRLLIEQPVGGCVSLYLPIQRALPSHQPNRLRLEQLLGQAETRLLARGLSLDAAQAILAPARHLLEEQAFWAHQSDGLAIFAAPLFFRVYRLPVAFEELVVVNERMHLTPLLPLLSDDGRFYLLTLGLDGVRLLQASHYTIRPIALPDVPAGLQDALKYDEFGRQPQWHPGIPGHSGARGAIFHGQGARDGRAEKEEILRYFQQVNDGVCAALHAERAPLVLAGLGYLLPIYREANTYARLVEEGIAENPDDLSQAELHTRTWAIMAPRFAHERAAACERFGQLLNAQPPLASSYIREIIPATHAGRVETLFVATGQRRWGSFDPQSDALALHEPAEPRDSELLDLAAIQTIVHGGTVYAVAPDQMPAPAPLAAIFRY